MLANDHNGIKLKNVANGVRGVMPKPIVVHNDSTEFAQTRFVLREAWNTSSANGSGRPRMLGSFRAVTNAGDLLSRQNYACGGSSQTPFSRPGLSGLGMRFGATSRTCMPSAVYNPLQLNITVPSSTCNVKYVYDSSDFIKFRRNQAINRNYNDISFGGNNSNGAQVAYRAVRRF
jgi:hypothetical protein